MQKNVGQTDKTIRLILGIIIAAVGLFFKSWWGLLGLVLIGTGITEFCGLYVPFGISTCSQEEEKTNH